MNKTSTLKNQYPSSKSRILDTGVPLLMLAAVTLLAFANAWPDILVFDDKLFAGPERNQELDSFYYAFTKDIWFFDGGNTGLYRPLLLLSLWAETRFFGDWLAGYHLSNIFQHLLVTLLVYGFFRHLLRRTSNQSSSSDLYALLAALVFAVHPVHTEVVNSIFNRSGMMVALFGLAGLWWLFHYLDTRRGWAWFGLGVAYFLGMLSKESAIIIPGLAVALILLLTPGRLITRIRKCLPVFWLLLPLALYLAMRAYALTTPEMRSVTQTAEGAEFSAMLNSVTLPDASAFLVFAGTLGESMKVIVWPYPLHLYYSWPPTPVVAGYAALHAALIIVSLVLLKWQRYGMAAGLAFFYIAMLPASRIISIGYSPPHVAERYLYFPSVGLAILLAFALRALTQRFGPRIVVSFGMPVLLLLAGLTWERNADWVSDVSLFEAEYQLGDRGKILLRMLTSAHLFAGNMERIVTICDENTASQEEYAHSKFVYYCAIAYENQNRNAAAERAYLLAIGDSSLQISIRVALANFYIRQERRQDAAKYFVSVIDLSDDPADKALYSGEMIISLFPRSRKQLTKARGYIEEALRLRPGWPKAEFMLKGVNTALNSSPGQTIDGKGSGT